MREIIMDSITYKDVNFKPSRYAFSFEDFPNMIEDIKIEIIGISSFIIFVGKVRK